ncbi:MAG: MarR family transcriptional regulator [Candidatus Thorarchaeota archaeon]|nr:MarR family transcriptional regulator [Candidatus Thorarchaeota archaeon]
MGISLPRSALIVLDNLASQGPACPKEIADRLDIAPRTVSFALRKLRKKELCKRVPNFHDMRKPKYLANKEKVEDLQAKIDKWRAQLNVQFKVL